LEPGGEKAVKVLLADDHQLLLGGLKKLLELHDVQIVGTAKNGLEAVAQARALTPDITLMDIRMPKMNGLEATRLIKAEMPEVKIVILTTSTEEKDLFEAVKSGACGYLLKSMDADELVEALQQTMQGIPPFSPGLAAKLLNEFARISKRESPASPQSTVEIHKENPETGLTARQIEVLTLVAQGLSYKEAGNRLNLSPNTVKYHMMEIMQKLHLYNRAQVLAYAGKMGLRCENPDM
jgi:DNA-binding NarL/FixJ family response regulator